LAKFIYIISPKLLAYFSSKSIIFRAAFDSAGCKILDFFIGASRETVQGEASDALDVLHL
jgi:hypothetical protein